MVTEAWHGKGPSKSFNAVAQVSDASHSFWVLKKEVLEILELSCRRQLKTHVLDYCYALTDSRHLCNQHWAFYQPLHFHMLQS